MARTRTRVSLPTSLFNHDANPYKTEINQNTSIVSPLTQHLRTYSVAHHFDGEHHYHPQLTPNITTTTDHQQHKVNETLPPQKKRPYLCTWLKNHRQQPVVQTPSVAQGTHAHETPQLEFYFFTSRISKGSFSGVRFTPYRSIWIACILIYGIQHLPSICKIIENTRPT